MTLKYLPLFLNSLYNQPFFRKSINKSITIFGFIKKTAKLYFRFTISGIEREYEQKLMPDGRFVVDGFLCVFDVSAVPNRNPEKQTELVAQIILNLVSEVHKIEFHGLCFIQAIYRCFFVCNAKVSFLT